MKKLFAFLFVALLFVGVQDVWAENVDACVNRFTGRTTILEPFSRKTQCRFWENPVSLSQNGNGGGGNGITAVQGDVVEISCPGSSLLGFAACPEGKLIVGATCLVDVTSGNPNYIGFLNNIWGDRNVDGSSQEAMCSFICGSGSPSGQYNGTPVAFCIGNPFNGE